MNSRTCSVQECDRPIYGHGWCSKHWKRWYKHGDPLANLRTRGVCEIEGCGRPHYALRLCAMHRARLKRHADPHFQSRNANGEGNTTHTGYRRVTVNGERVLEHRLIMEQMIGRKITRAEPVHHINRIRDDNRPENLMLLPTRSAHALLHSAAEPVLFRSATHRECGQCRRTLPRDRFTVLRRGIMERHRSTCKDCHATDERNRKARIRAP